MSLETEIEDLKHKRTVLANGYSRMGRPSEMNHAFDQINERCFAAKRMISQALRENVEPTDIKSGQGIQALPLVPAYRTAVGQLEMFIRLNP